MLLRAFAKINLDLRVLHRRSDGYHEIRTVLQTIDWYDEIRMDAADAFEFVTESSPIDESNLVVKAVREFEQRTGIAARVRVELKKRIPSGAGLGGGSSDAAVTLLGLQKVLGHQLPETLQVQCLRNLGSDVPFFGIGGRALGTNRGEAVVPLEDEQQYIRSSIVIVNPGFPISTKDAYSWLTLRDKFNSIEGFYAGSVPASPGQDEANDFEAAVFSRHPLLAEIKSDLLNLGARRASLSGSGSAVFGVFREEHAAGRAAAHLSGRFATRVTRPLSRVEYFERLFGG